MGASVSLRDKNGSTKEQSENQTIAALLLVISKNVLSMEQLINQIDSCEDIEELKNQLNEKQNHILKLIEEATTDIGQLTCLDSSEKGNPHRKLQKGRQREQYQNELKNTVEKFQSVQKLAAEKEDIMMRQSKHQDMKNEFETVKALILIITKKVRLMKQIIHQLTMIPENTEELLKKLDEVDHYTDLLISDASDCIKKQAESLIPNGSILLISDASDCIKKQVESLIPNGSINPNQDGHQALKLEDGISLLHGIDGLLSSIQILDTEKQAVMTNVNEYKNRVLRKKNKK